MTALIGTGSLYLLWLLYLAVMNLKRAKDAGTIGKAALYLGYPLLIVGLILDLICNVLFMTMLFFELPQEYTVSARVTRHSQQGGWRGDIARFFCERLLNQFDPSGKHCK